MIKNLPALHAAVAAVAPIDGVSADGAIWFQAGATPAQIAAAHAALSGFVDPAPAAVVGFQAPPMAPLAPLPKPKAITEA